MSNIKERRERTLNVHLPHRIKDIKEVECLFVGNFLVKLPRQSSKSCHVVFPNIQDKIKNYNLVKNKTINGKRIIVKSLRPLVPNMKIKQTRKKIFMPDIKPDIKVTQTLFVANITIDTKANEVQRVIPESEHVSLLKPYNKNFRSAIVKMKDIHTAAKFLKKKETWPILKGHRLRLKPDTRSKHKKRTLLNVNLDASSNV